MFWLLVVVKVMHPSMYMTFYVSFNWQNNTHREQTVCDIKFYCVYWKLYIVVDQRFHKEWLPNWLFQTDDANRVILKNTGTEGSDYINASWINVTTTIIKHQCCIYHSVELFLSCRDTRGKGNTLRHKVYSATWFMFAADECFLRQCLHDVVGISSVYTTGPKEETLEDFWRMISENQLTTIVMVTRTIEGLKVSWFVA